MMVAMVMVSTAAIPTSSTTTSTTSAAAPASIAAAAVAAAASITAAAVAAAIAAPAPARRSGRSAATLVTTAGWRLGYGSELEHDQQVFAGGHDLRRERLIARNVAQPRASRGTP
jgi:hypothetical protein